MEADEEDCAAALRFWTSKKVLKEIEDPMTGDMMYEIIENQQNEWDNDDTVMDQVRGINCDGILFSNQNLLHRLG